MPCLFKDTGGQRRHAARAVRFILQPACRSPTCLSYSNLPESLFNLPESYSKLPESYCNLCHAAFGLSTGARGQGRHAARLDESYSNLAEASVALRLMLLLGTDPSVRSIAILSPYNAQVSGCGTCCAPLVCCRWGLVLTRVK